MWKAQRPQQDTVMMSSRGKSELLVKMSNETILPKLISCIFKLSQVSGNCMMIYFFSTETLIHIFGA